MIKGVQCFTVRNYMKDREQFIDSLKKIKAIGYESVQVGIPSFIEASELKVLLDEIGLVYCTQYSDYAKLLADDGEVSNALSKAKLFGVDVIGIGTMPESLRDHRDGFLQFAEGMNTIGQKLSKEGCKLLYHPHALEFFSFGDGHGMDILFNETDPASVNFCLDTHWMAAAGVNYVDWIYKARGRMPIIHFKDYAITGGAKVIEEVKKVFAEVGRGNLDWASIVKACHDTGVAQAVVEQDISADPFESLEISFGNMVKLEV